MTDDFVNLHLHSHHSLLDGYGSPEAYVRRATILEQPAIALTDHGTFSGAYDFYQSCRKYGVKPIVGVEAYVAATYWDAKDKTPIPIFSGNGAFGHLTLLAKSRHGLQNLMTLLHLGYVHGFYRKPRIDLEQLEAFSTDVICLTGCAAGHLSTYLRHPGNGISASEFLEQLIEIFGNDLYIEMMDHGIDTEDLNELELNQKLVSIADVYQLPIVATNDAHYVTTDQHPIQQALLCVATNDQLSNPNRFRFNGNQPFHLATREEMLLRRLPTEAIDTTILIADDIGNYSGAF